MAQFKVGQVILNGEHVWYGGTAYSVAGASASVETDGEVVARFTATRLIFLGVFALAFKKKKDQRGLFLMVEGPEFAFVAVLDPKKDMVGARTMAQAINQAGKQFAIRAVTVHPGLPPAAWYPHPTDKTLQQYWDGATWTEHTAPA